MINKNLIANNPLSLNYRRTESAENLLSKIIVLNKAPIILTLMSLFWAIYWIPKVPLFYYSNYKDLLLFVFIVPAIIPAITGLRISRLYHTEHGKISLWLTIVVACGLPSVVASQNLSVSLTAYLRFLIVLPIFIRLTMIFMRDPKVMETVFKLMTIPVIISSIYVVFSLFGIISFEPPARFIRSFGSEGFLMGLSYRTGGMAWSIAFVAPIMTYYGIMEKSKYLKVFWLTSLGICLFVCSMMLNRGGFIAAILSSILTYFIIMRKSRSLWNYILFIVIIILLFNSRQLFFDVALFHSTTHSRGYEDVDYSYESFDDLSSGRLARYSHAIQLIRNISLFGTGFKQDIEQAEFSSLGFHNLFLNQFVSTGIIGGLVMIYFFYIIVKLTLVKFREVLRSKHNIFFLIPIINLFVHYVSTTIEGGFMFNTVYLGISFYFSLAALSILPNAQSKTILNEIFKDKNSTKDNNIQVR